jgi:hypothetical protein
MTTGRINQVSTFTTPGSVYECALVKEGTSQRPPFVGRPFDGLMRKASAFDISVHGGWVGGRQ